MTVRELAEKSQSKSREFAPSLTRVAQASQVTREAAQQLGVGTQAAQALVVTELNRISPAVQAVQTTLREGQQRVLERMAACEEQVAALRSLMQESQAGLSQATAAVHRDAQTLLAALPEVQAKLQGLVDSQAAQMGTDKSAQEAALERLRGTLALLATTVSRVTEQGHEAAKDVGGRLTAVTDALAGVGPDLGKIRDHLHNESQRIGSAYQAALADIEVGRLKPESARIASETRSALDEQVAKPARAGVGQLALEAETLGQQLRQHEQEVQPSRQNLERTFKDLQSGPQLRVLVKASKQVLQKVGKLSVLGPLAQSL